MEVPKDVLPRSSEVVVEETNEEVVKTEEVTPTPPVQPKVEEPKGSKTPAENLYAALEEERRKRKELEEKLYSVSSEPQITEAFSDEGKLLESKIKSLEGTINSLQEEKILSALYTQYPELKSLSSEFETYKQDFPSTKVENVAKLFLAEKGMLETPRKGLEKTTGGQAPTSSGLSAEEVANLRKNNHRKYLDMLMSGKIRLDELS